MARIRINDLDEQKNPATIMGGNNSAFGVLQERVMFGALPKPKYENTALDKYYWESEDKISQEERQSAYARIIGD